ncbi:type III PLP-dependent enzyme [Melghirimyces algeriensis]|uniref:Diaminopimelate decarboxylase n=1 Tax=Melghirimyces algeriensis TaxID=910412 RepID=A0A521F279_9BACL|nr:type III PLP-dependent enzyme [Melghirimyces algeriensis]SMO90217.1 diaminopimelate decarboxylase [Melghirimyces algeriensis]
MNARFKDWIDARKHADNEPICAYLYDLDHLEKHTQKVVSSLPGRFRMYYAMKANSEREILKSLSSVIDGFEVASLGEVEKAKEAGGNLPIIFGGPGKTDGEIEAAIRLGVERIHVESVQELRRVAWIAKKQEAQMPILLRVNLRGPFPSATLHMAGRPTQFGINEEEIPQAVRLAQELDGVKLEGFHFHSLSNNLDVERHIQLLHLYVNKILAWEKELGIQVTVLNVGGGIGVDLLHPEQSFDWDRFLPPLTALEQGLPDTLEMVQFECGRYLTATCGCYAVEVLDLKQNHGKHYAVIRGGTHHFRLPVSWQYSHPFEVVPVERWDYPFPRQEVVDSPVTVVGQLCTPKDVLAHDIPVSRIRVGDVLLFHNTGAYGWSISHHDFLSHPHPEQHYFRLASPLAHVGGEF